MEALMLCYRDEALREFPLGGAPIEIGRGPRCDIVVHDEAVAERHALVVARGGDVLVFDLRGTGRPSGASHKLLANEPLALGRHTLVRLPDAPTRPRLHTSSTEPMAFSRSELESSVLVVGRGSEARRLPLEGRPVRVGSAGDNDLVLHDRTVSAHHCRLEPCAEGVAVRDLESRNGTWVDGLRVERARLCVGGQLRIGRTDVVLVARGRSGDARHDGLVAASPRMLAVLAEVERLARLPWTVLVTGESGAGKEGIARALHHRGPRAARPLVSLNAGSLTRELIESELFGHEKGAFTGAHSQRKGAFELADGGTLFLDEIAELPLEMQARLLRVLDTGEVRRVGSGTTVHVDVRLVCATHRDLRQMVAQGAFRRDLYYRVAQCPLEVPPLRERPEDVRALAAHFLEDIAKDAGRRTLTDAAMTCLLAHSWPGNARELRNVLRAAVAQTAAGTLDRLDVQRALVRLGSADALDESPASRDALSTAIDAHRGNLSAAARALGIPRTTLRDRMRGA
jgi:transcriptional regulator with AAA-type ATPase domain